MGVDYSAYLGPYVRCKVHKVPSTKTVRTCSNDKCKAYGGGHVYSHDVKFCKDCGSSVQERAIPIEVDSVNIAEMRDGLLDQSLCLPGGDSLYRWMEENNTHLWISNRKVPNTRKWHYDAGYETAAGYEAAFEPTTPELIATEIEKFSSFYEKELFILRQEYGEDNVEIQWGFFLHAS